MRCPQCSTNHPYRLGMTCSSCEYNFLFNPKFDTFTDNQYKKMLDRISDDGNVFFTKNQLFSFYLNIGRSSLLKKLIAWVFVLASLVFLLYPFPNPETNFNVFRIVLFAVSMTYAMTLWEPSKIDKLEFDDILKKWMATFPIPNLITGLGLHEPPPNFEEEDLYNYGVEGLMIVDQDIYVDLFVMNNYHTHWKSVVISQHGYPNYLQDKIQKIIDENPSLKIYYLHDASTSLSSMKTNARTFLRLGNSIEEIDMGLNEDDAKKLNAFKQRKDETGGLKLDFIPPSRLSGTMSMALLGGLLLSEALETRESMSNFISDFG